MWREGLGCATRPQYSMSMWCTVILLSITSDRRDATLESDGRSVVLPSSSIAASCLLRCVANEII